MIKKSFFNPFSSLLLALAGLAFLVDVVPQAQGQTGRVGFGIGSARG